MKRFFTILLAVSMVLCIMMPLFAFALDNGAQDNGGNPAASNDSMNITVMMPQAETTAAQEIADPLPAPLPKPNPNSPALYPTDVYEFYDESSRQIIKTYELADNENPAGISRDDFERDGWLYTLVDITKKENAYAATKEHIETVTVGTSSRDMDVILTQLAPTMQYKTNDGYIGVLSLDIASIKVETTGTKKSGYTMTATREYPHLSSNDTALIPKTITQNGVTYTLEGVTWQTQSNAPVDYDQIPESYTAAAKYTATGTKTTVTGYTTTAEYKGTVSKILTGRTLYTAYFMGEKIAFSAKKLFAIKSDQAVPGTAPALAASDQVTGAPSNAAENSGEGLPPWIAVLIAIVLLAAGGIRLYFLRKNVKEKEGFITDEKTD